LDTMTPNKGMKLTKPGGGKIGVGASQLIPSVGRTRWSVAEPLEVDKDGHEAYVRSVEADKLLAQGNVAEAQRVMAEAAALDGTYSIRAKCLGQPDSRRPRVSSTIRRIVLPVLVDAGFSVDGGGLWSDGCGLSREVDGVAQSVLIGRHKFGHRLGVTLARYRSPGPAEYYTWRTIGIRSGSLAYATQLELEAVCTRWCELIREYGLPWFGESWGARRPTRGCS
jgi:hypothetical protein